VASSQSLDFIVTSDIGPAVHPATVCEQYEYKQAAATDSGDTSQAYFEVRSSLARLTFRLVAAADFHISLNRLVSRRVLQNPWRFVRERTLRF
jgi:hypothetical protein